MGGGGGDHQAATERHLRPLRQAPRGPAARVRVQLPAPGHDQAAAGTRRLRPVRQAIRRPEREPADPRLPVPGRRLPQAPDRAAAQGALGARANVRAADRDKQRARIAAVRDRERERSRARVARLKASYELRLAAARAKARTAHKSPDKPAAAAAPAARLPVLRRQRLQRPVCVAFKEGYRNGHRTATSRATTRDGPRVPRRHRRVPAGAPMTRRNTR